jgi:hypothetical protein
MWTCPYRLYTNQDKNELMAEHDEGSVLLCGEWDTIPRELAERLGLVDADGTTHSPLAIKRRLNKEAKAQEDQT